MRTQLSVVAIIAAAVLSAPAFAAIKWRGDFETGDLSQYGSKQMVSPDRIQVVSSHVYEGTKAAKFTVIQGDDPINASGNRNELVRKVQDPEGADVYYRWQTNFATDFPSASTWQLFAQWHQPENYGSPPLQFYIYGEEMRLTLGMDQRQVWKTPFVRGKWHDFILHVKWSDTPGVGFIELWYNGVQVLPKTFGMTRANTWMKLGLYRNENISAPGVVYHDGMVLGDTYADVMNAYASAAAPAPVVPTPTSVVPTPTSVVPPVVTIINPDVVTVPGDSIDLMPTPGANGEEQEPSGAVEQPVVTETSTVDEEQMNAEATTGGCSATGGSMAAFATLALGALLRRRRAKV